MSATDPRLLRWALMRLTRELDARFENLLLTGRVSKWYSEVGNEATTVAAGLALEPGDTLATLHRDLGAILAVYLDPARTFPSLGLGAPDGRRPEPEALLYRLACQLLGRADGFSQGVERSFHYGYFDPAAGISHVGMISHLGAMIPVAAGCAFAARHRGTDRVALNFIGEGGTSTGDFHEALNMAAVWKLPLVLVIENNRYAFSTPWTSQYAVERLSDRAAGYGMAGETVDGNDPDAVAAAMARAVERARAGEGPTLLEAMLGRMRGHSEGDDSLKVVPADDLERFRAGDPVPGYARRLEEEGVLDGATRAAIEERAAELVEEALGRALAADEPAPEVARRPVFATEAAADAPEAVDGEATPAMAAAERGGVGDLPASTEGAALSSATAVAVSETSGGVASAGAAEAPPAPATGDDDFWASPGSSSPPPDSVASVPDAGAQTFPSAADPSPPTEAGSADSSAVAAAAPVAPPASESPSTYVEAIHRALTEEMERDESVVLMGQDIGVFEGAFRVTRGLHARWPERVLDTPIAESGALGIAIGAALSGLRPVVEMQFADFVSCGFNQLVNVAAKLYYRWRVPCPIVVRLPSGGGVGAGPFHSQNPEAWFAHTAGLKVVCPATAADALGLVKAAIRDPDPVLIFEHKYLYRRIKEVLPEGDHPAPIGRARVARRGSDLTLVGYGASTWTCLDAAETLASEGVEAEVIDLRTLVPYDEATVAASVRKTGRALVAHEAQLTGGFGAEIAARLADACFSWLDAPVRRVAWPDRPVPFAKGLERELAPSADRVVRAARELLRY